MATTWYVNSKASKHIVGDPHVFTKLNSTRKNSNIKIADGKAYPIIGTRDAHVLSSNGAIKFQKVLYVFGVQKNLLSLGKITNQNLGIYFYSSHFYILKLPDLSRLGTILATQI